MIVGGGYRNSKETVYNKFDDHIISEFMWQPLFIFITILLLVSYNTCNAFLNSIFFQDIALKLIPDVPKLLGIEFPQRGF